MFLDRTLLPLAGITRTQTNLVEILIICYYEQTQLPDHSISSPGRKPMKGIGIF